VIFQYKVYIQCVVSAVNEELFQKELQLNIYFTNTPSWYWRNSAKCKERCLFQRHPNVLLLVHYHQIY